MAQPLFLSRRYGGYTYHCESQQAADELAERLHEAVARALSLPPDPFPGVPRPSAAARTRIPARALRGG